MLKIDGCHLGNARGETETNGARQREPWPSRRTGWDSEQTRAFPVEGDPRDRQEGRGGKGQGDCGSPEVLTLGQAEPRPRVIYSAHVTVTRAKSGPGKGWSCSERWGLALPSERKLLRGFGLPPSATAHPLWPKPWAQRGPVAVAEASVSPQAPQLRPHLGGGRGSQKPHA